VLAGGLWASRRNEDRCEQGPVERGERW